MSTTPFGSEQPTYSQPPAANTMPTMPTAPTMPTGPAATTASVITDDEKTAIRQGVFGALAYVSQADPGFFATFVESAAGAKALSAAPAAVQQLLSGGLVLPEASSAEEFRAQAIPRLQAAVQLADAKDPAAGAALKQVVLQAVEAVAAASKGVSANEQQAIAAIRAALG